MPFDVDRWLAAILASAQETMSPADLLEAAGLTDPDYFEDDIAFLMAEIEADLDEAERYDAEKSPPEPPASS